MLGSVAGDGDGEAKEAGDDDAERERVIRWGRLRTVVEMAFFLRLEFESLSLLDWPLDSDSDFRLDDVSCIEELEIFLDVWKYWFSLPLKLVFLLTGTSSESSVAGISSQTLLEKVKSREYLEGFISLLAAE